MTNEEIQVAETLRGFASRIDDILLLIQEPLRLSKESKVRAQELLRTLKEDMNSLHRSLDTVKARATMNAAEQAYLAPTIHEASATINVKWNSNPSHQWYSELYDALTTIRHSLHQLDDRDPNG